MLTINNQKLFWMIAIFTWFSFTFTFLCIFCFKGIVFHLRIWWFFIPSFILDCLFIWACCMGNIWVTVWFKSGFCFGEKKSCILIYVNEKVSDKLFSACISCAYLKFTTTIEVLPIRSLGTCNMSIFHFRTSTINQLI